jgi:hypothetical protein
MLLQWHKWDRWSDFSINDSLFIVLTGIKMQEALKGEVVLAVC